MNEDFGSVAIGAANPKMRGFVSLDRDAVVG